MRGIRRIFRLPVLQPRDADREVDDEIAFHLAMREAALRARGIPASDASRVARDRFGDIEGIREECVREFRAHTRTERAMLMLEEAHRDAMFALRSLWRAKSFSIAVILTLALGIGANAMIFSIIQAVVMRPVAGVRDPADLFELGDALSYPAYRSLHERLPRFEFAAVSERRIALGTGAATEHTTGALVSGNFFELLGARAEIGRPLGPRDDTPGAPAVGALAHAYWVKALAGDSSIIGRTITVNGAPITVVGVVGREFRGLHLGEVPDVWLPIHAWAVIAPSLRSSSIESTGWEWLRIIGRTAPGTPTLQMRRDIGGILREDPEVRREAIEQIATPRPMQAAALASGAREAVVRFSTILAAVVGLVLITACANIAGLLLARAAYREREIAVRIALGARRGRLVRQFLTEALVLAAAGGMAGFGAFAIARAVLSSATLPGGISGSALALPMDPRVIAFAAVITLITGLLFGVIPALQASRPDTIAAIRGASSVRGMRSQMLRGMLVAAQVTVGVVLLAGTGLFARALTRAFAVDLGFRTENLVTLTVDPSLAQLDPQRANAYVADVTERVAAIPGVSGVTWTDSPILTVDFNRYGATISGYTPAPNERIRIETNVVGPRYHEVVGIPMVRGRGFDERDAAGSELVLVINETLARTYFAGRDPIGETITMQKVPARVIGVARDARYHGLNETPRPYAYVPLLQLPPGSVGVPTLIARTTADPASHVREIVSAARSVNSAVPVFAATTMSDHLRALLAPQVAGAWLLGVFSALALVVAAVGIYGIVAYTVSRRTREIGIRMALGARAPSVLRLVMGRNLAFIALGIPLGIGLALILARVAARFLYGVGTTDALTFSGTAAVMMIIGMAASYIPARRAVRIDPLVALRTDD